MSEFTNRQAVNAVEKQSLRMKWFFRSQDISDQGIDAHVEEVQLVREPGKPIGEVGTGRLIALQIKGGPSYFERPSANGWWFSFSSKKARLWLGHALPVVVVLVDLETDVIYWQRISSGTVQSTGQGFKVEVPASQTMSSADAEWRHIASGLETRADARFEYALTQLPPPVRAALESRPQGERLDAALMAFHLAEGRANARGTAQSLLATSPVWIERNASWAWSIVGTYASQHEHYDVSAEAFERAARSTTEGRGGRLAAAALNVMQFDRARSEDLLNEAAATGEAPLLVAVGRSLLAQPEGDAGPSRIDPILLEDTVEIRKSSIIQGFLADQTSRAGDLETAVRHWRLQLNADPENTHIMHTGAAILHQRWGSKGAAEDLTEAVELLERAIEQRRRWAGPTLALVLDLARAYTLEGRFDSVLQICLPAPTGSATQEEANEPKILRLALQAADFLGRQDLASELAKGLGDTVGDRILKMRLGILNPSTDEAKELWKAEFDRAIAACDYPQVANAAITLADLGVDKRATLEEYVAQSVMAQSLIDLASALLEAQSDLDTALPALRTLARDDIVAAEHLIMKLRRAERYLEAAEACHALYATGGNPWFLIQRASCLIDADDERAETVATAAANATQGYPVERARLLTFLGAEAGNRGKWDVAEQHLNEVLTLFRVPDAGHVWRVVIAQLNQGKGPSAAKTFAKYRPNVRTKEEAELWLHANSTVRWDEARASEALALARRFPDPKLSTALLGSIITNTYGVDPERGEDNIDDDELRERRRLGQTPVSAELHREAFAVMEKLASEFGDETGIRVLRGKPDELLDQITGILKGEAKSDAPFRDLVKAVSEATLPLGFVAGLRGHGYATVLVQRAFGVLVSGSADDDEHSIEVGAARAAMGKTVVVDAASLLTLSGNVDLRSLSGQFVSLHVPAASMRDLHRAAFEIRGWAGSPGSLMWDADSSALALRDLESGEYTRQLRRTEALESFAQSLPVRVVGKVTLLGEIGGETAHAPWAHPIQLAHDDGLTLWSDDLGLRRLARQLGVSCFGTPALIDAVRDRALEKSSTSEADEAAIRATTSANRLLAQDLVVDLVLDEGDLVMLAERDEWIPRAGGAILARASWWLWHKEPLGVLLDLYARVREAKPESLPSWQLSAMAGAGKASQDGNVCAKLLAAVALIGYGPAASDEEIIEGMQRARGVAQHLGLPDPDTQLPSAAAGLGRLGMCDKPNELADRILTALQELSMQEGETEG